MRILLILVLFVVLSFQQKDGTILFPGRSCKDVLDNYHYMRSVSTYQPYLIPDGTYFLTNGVTTYPIFCEMSTGGYTLLLRADGTKGTFSYYSYWTDTATLNEHTFTATEAKYESYNHVAFNRLKIQFIVDGVGGNAATNRSIIVRASGTSLLARMNAGTYAAFDVPAVRSDWIFLGGPRMSFQDNCNTGGFNFRNSRIGFYTNNENDCDTPDTAIGLGFQSSPFVGSFIIPARATILVSDVWDCSTNSYCSGRGLCTSSGCVCHNTAQFAGTRCATPVCYGVLATATGVCSGKGSCVSPDLCVCQHGFSGAQCEEVYDVSGYGTQAMPARSCFEILTKYRAKNMTALSRVYFLYDGSYTNTYPAYCDMETNGGGWTMVMKVLSSSSTFQYDSIHWKTKSTLNTHSTNFDDVEAKFASFHAVNVHEVMIQSRTNLLGFNAGYQTNSIIKRLNTSSLYTVFVNDEERQFDTVGTTTEWKNLQSSFSSLQTTCTREVINYKQLSTYNNDERQKLRMGIIASDEHCGHPKGFIGIGASVGWNGLFHGNTMKCLCAADNGLRSLQSTMFVFVRETNNCSAVNHCSGNGRCIGNNICACDHEYSGSNCSLKKIWGSPTHPASSCAHIFYQNATDNVTSGVYHIALSNVGTTPVYCAFPQLWALAVSFTNDISIGGGYMQDSPKSSTSPNFQEYRMSLAQFQAMHSISTEWAATCNGNLTFLDDYMLDTTANSYLLQTLNGDCRLIKDISIRGYRRRNVNVKLFNTATMAMHTDTDAAPCEVNGFSAPGATRSENNFGYYVELFAIKNRQFSCTATDSSTTNFWLRTNCSVDVCGRKGVCVNDACSCLNGYSGIACKEYFCFGIKSSDPLVCNRYGKCVAPNTCQCDPGVIGEQCTLGTMCHGVRFTDGSICSGHGVCAAGGSCSCFGGFGGPLCNLFSCNGIPSSESNVCSGHGTCINSNLCQCTAGYTGMFCSIHECFGISSNATETVCNGHGSCVAINNCSCSTNYVGRTCNVSVCFGINSTSTSVCSFGNGTCIGPNNCSCNVGYFGSECQNFTCYNITHLESQVCSGHGSCRNFNNCSCVNGYTGDRCQIPICFNITGTDSKVCSNSNGTCTAFDTCVCMPGYSGAQCELPICFNLTANQTSLVCNNGNGTCIARDTCLCNDGYTGNSCHIPTCNGTAATSPFVCNFRNGSCVLKDTCHCNSNYTGIWCQFPICYGYSSISSSVCSGNGSCVAPNRCNCFANYEGANCSIPICYNISARISQVCSSHGTCISANNCACYNNWSGDRCQTPYCFGISAANSSVCNGHGLCSNADTCTCNVNYGGIKCEHERIDSNGYTILYNYVETNTSLLRNIAIAPSFHIRIASLTVAQYQEGVIDISNRFAISLRRDFELPLNDIPECLSSIDLQIYSREMCTYHSRNSSHFTCVCHYSVRAVTYGYIVAFVSNFNLSRDGQTLTAYAFLHNPLNSVTISCMQLLSNTSFVLLGRPSNCSINSTILSISIRNVSLSQNNVIEYNTRFGYNMTSIFSKARIFSQQPPPVVRIIQFGICEYLSVDASLSSHADNVPLQYQWRIIPVDNLALQQAILSQPIPSSITIAKEQFTPNITYTIVITVLTPHGVSDSLNTTAEYGKSPLPSLLAASTQVNAFRSSPTRLSFDICYTGNSSLQFIWSQISGPNITMPNSNSSSLIIPPLSFPSTNQTYIFALTARMLSSRIYDVTQSITVFVVSRTPVAIINGGSRSLSSTLNNFTLNASMSSDPDMFLHTCRYNWSSQPQGDGLLPLFSPITTSVAALTLFGPFRVGIHIVQLRMICDTRLSNIASISIEFIDGIPPVVEIIPSGSIVSVQTRLTLSCYVERILNNPMYTYQWSMMLNGIQQRIPSEIFLTPEDAGIIRFAENSLLEGAEYRFRVDVASRVNQRKGFTEISVRTTKAPVIIDFIVSPTNGTTISTTFLLSCRRWDGASDMRFTFGYVNPDESYSYISSSQPVNALAATLPVGRFPGNTMRLFAMVTDDFGGFAMYFTNVTVMPLTFTSTNALLEFAGSASSNIDSIAKQDPNQALQLASNIAALLNGPALQDSDCRSHGCSGHGVCNGACTCYNGFFGDDCSKSNEQLQQAKSLRDGITNSIIRASSTQQLTTDSLYVASSALGQVTKKPSEVSLQTQTNVLSYLNSSMLNANGAKISVDSETMQTLLDTVGNVAVASLNPRTGNPSNNTAQLITNVVALSASVVSNNLIPDEVPTTIRNQFVSMSVAVASPNNTRNRQIQLNDGPSTIMNNTINSNESLSISYVTYALNPFSYSSTSTNITSAVLDFKLQGASTGRVYSKLDNPIIFVFRGNYSLSQFTLNESLAGIRPSCQYWDVQNQTWSKAGCVVTNITATELTCACSHLTSFASFVKFEMPKLNILSVQDFALITQLNTDNMTTAIMIGCIIGVYLIAFVFGSFVKTILYFCNTKVEDDEDTLPSLSARPFLTYLERLRSSMLWLSIFVPPTNKYSQYNRLQRLTVYVISIEGVFTTSAVLYGSSQGVPVNDFLTGFVASLISAIVILILSSGFSFSRKITPYIKLITQKETNSSSRLRMYNEKFMQRAQNLKTRIRKFTEKCVFVLDAIVVKIMLSLQNYIQNSSSSKLSITKIFLIILLMAGMASGVGVFLFIMHTFYWYIWDFYYSLIIICLAPSVAFMIPAIVSYQLTRLRYFATGTWKQQQSLYIGLFLAIAVFINAMGVAGLCFYFEFLFRRKDQNVFLIVEGGLLSLVICCIFTMILHAKQPSKNETIDEPSFLLPWWFVYLWYPVNWAVMGFLAYVLIIYGIKFSREQVSKWLISTAIGIAYGILLDPIKSTMTILVTGTIQFAFFGVLTREQ